MRFGVLILAAAKMFARQPVMLHIVHSFQLDDRHGAHDKIQDDPPPTEQPKRDGQKYGGSKGDARRILNLTDDSEKPLGEWNKMVIEAKGNSIKVWVNGDLVNHGTDATVSKGKIALQAEGTEVEFKNIFLTSLKK